MNQFLPPFDHPLMSGSSHTFWRCLWWPIHRCRRRRVPLECAMTAAWGNEHNANRTRIEYFSNARRMYTLYPDVNVHMSKTIQFSCDAIPFSKIVYNMFVYARTEESKSIEAIPNFAWTQSTIVLVSDLSQLFRVVRKESVWPGSCNETLKHPCLCWCSSAKSASHEYTRKAFSTNTNSWWSYIFQTFLFYVLFFQWWNKHIEIGN